MIYATSDLHGCPPDDFLRLLEKAGFGDSDTLYVLGDVIDRNGDGGVAMLRWIMSRPNVEMLLGNHEAMLLNCAFLFREGGDLRTEGWTANRVRHLERWSRNGCRPTVEALHRLGERNPAALEALLEFLRGLPLWRRVCASGRECLLVHAGLGGFSPEKKLEEYAQDELLWYRPAEDERFFPDILTVFGHTPTGYRFGKKGRMFRTDTWIDIDTGAAGGGMPMLLRLDDLKEFYAGE